MRLFALEGSQRLGRAVAGAIGVELSPIEERVFEDGEHKSRPLVSVRNEDVYVLHTLHGAQWGSPDERLVRLLFFLAACRDNGAGRVTAVVPYLAFMRKEQRTRPRDPVTSRYLAQLFEAVGADMVVTVEVHNPAAFQNAFRCGTMHLDAAPLLVDRLRGLAGDGRVVVLAPDSGGIKRAHRLKAAYEEGGREAGFAMVEKHRSESGLTGDLFAGDVEGATVAIVDDMIATGGTMLRAARAASARGAKRVFALATHGLFSRGSAELFAAPQIERVIVTDTVDAALPQDIHGGKLDVLGCAELLGEAIRCLRDAGPLR